MIISPSEVVVVDAGSLVEGSNDGELVESDMIPDPELVVKVVGVATNEELAET